MSLRALAAAGAATLFVAGCATPVAPTVVAPPAAPPNFWSGRFAVTYAEGGYQPREERSSGRFTLLANGERRELDLSSPLGQTIAQVTLDSGEAVLVASDGSRYRAPSAETLTEQVFGWRVPIGDLPRWLAGRVAKPTQREDGRVVAGVDGGWSVRFEAFEGERPRRLALDWPADGADGGASYAARRLELKLVVDSVARVDAGASR
ncbi:MAG: outer membrane lipoprotein LolB [Burkholderiaceae bacterium]|nr:outer membrane lipoprotein LolB [Burkholderiaceae bacterium]